MITRKKYLKDFLQEPKIDNALEFKTLKDKNNKNIVAGDIFSYVSEREQYLALVLSDGITVCEVRVPDRIMVFTTFNEDIVAAKKEVLGHCDNPDKFYSFESGKCVINDCYKGIYDENVKECE